MEQTIEQQIWPLLQSNFSLPASRAIVSGIVTCLEKPPRPTRLSSTMSLRSTRRRMFNHYMFHSSSAMKFGSSPWHRYSSQSDEDPQSFLSRKISSVKVDPDDPINTLDIAQIVLSSIASTFILQMNRYIRPWTTNKQNSKREWAIEKLYNV